LLTCVPLTCRGEKDWRLLTCVPLTCTSEEGWRLLTCVPLTCTGEEGWRLAKESSSLESGLWVDRAEPELTEPDPGAKNTNYM
jgi:hypothetical protein